MFFLQPLMKGWSMCRKRRLVPSILTSCGRWLRIIRHIWRLVSWRSHVASFWWFVLDGWVSPTSPKCRGYHYCKLWGNIMTCLRYWLWLQEKKRQKYIGTESLLSSPVSLAHLWRAHGKKQQNISNPELASKNPRLCWCSTMESTTGTLGSHFTPLKLNIAAAPEKLPAAKVVGTNHHLFRSYVKLQGCVNY